MSRLDLVERYMSWNVADFAMKNPEKLDTDTLRQITEQIQSRQKSKEKLPTWFANQALIFPPPISVEQASSERTAQYKAALVSGNLVDLTGGMGLDTWAFAQTCQQVLYVERQARLVEVAKHNFQALGMGNINLIHADSNEVLPFAQADVVYLDPARRSASNAKLMRLEDCEPNVLGLKSLIFEKSPRILLKTSPLLDIKLAITQLENVAEVHVVALGNEVKELLFLMKKGFVGETNIKAIDVASQQAYVFTYTEENQANSSFTTPQAFLYEPHAALLKSGAFRLLGAAFGVHKIGGSTHLYTSEKLIPKWFGRVFDVIAIEKLDTKAIHRHLPEGKANISVRNFPMTVDEIKKKLKISDGGEVYLFAMRDFQDNKIIVVGRKVKQEST